MLELPRTGVCCPACSFPPTSRPVPTEVGRKRLGRERLPLREGVGIWVDEPGIETVSLTIIRELSPRLPEYCGCSLAETPHIKHHHMHQKLTNSGDENCNVSMASLDRTARKSCFDVCLQSGLKSYHLTLSKRRRMVHKYSFPLDNTLDILRSKVPSHQPGWLIGWLLPGGKLQSMGI